MILNQDNNYLKKELQALEGVVKEAKRYELQLQNSLMQQTTLQEDSRGHLRTLQLQLQKEQQEKDKLHLLQKEADKKRVALEGEVLHFKQQQEFNQVQKQEHSDIQKNYLESKEEVIRIQREKDRLMEELEDEKGERHAMEKRVEQVKE